MKIDIHNNVGKVVGNIEIDKKFLVSESNFSVVRQAVLSELANLRQGTHSSKNRSAVRGGGKKPWKQKGRGVAKVVQERWGLSQAKVHCVLIFFERGQVLEVPRSAESS